MNKFYVYFAPYGHYGEVDLQTKKMEFDASNFKELKRYAKEKYKEATIEWKKHRDNTSRHARTMRWLFLRDYFLDYVVIEKNKEKEVIRLFDLYDIING